MTRPGVAGLTASPVTRLRLASRAGPTAGLSLIGRAWPSRTASAPDPAGLDRRAQLSSARFAGLVAPRRIGWQPVAQALDERRAAARTPPRFPQRSRQAHRYRLPDR